MHLCRTNTQWMGRTQQLAECYDVPQVHLTETLRPDWRWKVRDRDQEAENAKWRSDAGARSSLQVYCEAKVCISREDIYDKSKGRGLLCEAACGGLG